MPAARHRLIAIGSALSWFLVGMHVPIVHRITHHGLSPHWSIVVAIAALTVLAVATLWMLLRSPARPTA